MKENLIPVNIFIGDRHFRVKVSPADEFIMRQTVKIINDKITEFKKNFPGKDMQDYISMVLIWYATEETTRGLSMPDEKLMLEKLSQIENHIDAALTQVSQ
jgi:cell division protein ZapA